MMDFRHFRELLEKNRSGFYQMACSDINHRQYIFEPDMNCFSVNFSNITPSSKSLIFIISSSSQCHQIPVLVSKTLLTQFPKSKYPPLHTISDTSAYDIFSLLHGIF